MRAVPLTPELHGAWNQIVASSRGGWFWHTTDWLRFVKALGADALIDDLSFLLYVDSDPVAVCPLILEERRGYRCFTYLGEFLPFPAFDVDVDDATQARGIDRYAAHVATLAAQHNVAYSRVAVPVLAPSAIAGGGVSNSLLRYGYFDVSVPSQVIDLRPSEEVLWRDIRKGHRSDIKRGAAACEIHVWTSETVTPEIFAEYRHVHARDAGRVTRVAETFDIMFEWIQRGHALLVEARAGGRTAAFAMVLTFGRGAYYASSCKEPDLAGIPAMHLLQWEIMRTLRARGIEHYDIGAQYFAPRWDYVPSAKECSIASFKRGFGGVTRRVDIVERFFSSAVLERVGTERLQALMASQAIQVSDD